MRNVGHLNHGPPVFVGRSLFVEKMGSSDVSNAGKKPSNDVNGGGEFHDRKLGP